MNEPLLESLDLFKVKLFDKKTGGSSELKKQYYEGVCTVAKLCHDLFEQHGAYAGQFTSHGPDHSARVMKHALKLCSQLDKPFKAVELYLLGLAIFTHDLGMTERLPEDISRRCNSEYDRWSEIRARHADVIEDVIIKYGKKELKKVKETDQILYDHFLPQVCLSHSSKNFVKAIDYFRDHRHLNKEMGIRYGHISGYLLLADELDIERERACQDYSRYEDFSNLSKAHWWKHWIVTRCIIDNKKIMILSIPEEKISGAQYLAEWVKCKIEKQIAFLSTRYDNPGVELFDYSVEIIPDMNSDSNCGDKKPTDEIMNIVKSETNNLSPNKKPKYLRLINRVNDPNKHMNPTVFYSKIVSLFEEVFRGQGELGDEDFISYTYIKDENIDLLNHYKSKIISIFTEKVTMLETAISHETLRRSNPNKIRNFFVVTGNVGIGKTHFLGYLLYILKNEYPDLIRKSIMVRCECTINPPVTFSAIKRKIVEAIVYELRNLQCIEELEQYLQQKQTRIPTESEIPLMTEKQVDAFIAVIFKLINDYNCRKTVGEDAPVMICLFLDNSDKLPNPVLEELDQWAYKVSLDCLTFMFYRPNVWDKIATKIQYDYRSTRVPRAVNAPSMQKIVAKRIDYLFEKKINPKVTKDVRLTDIDKTIKISDAKTALTNICLNLVGDGSDILPSLADGNVRLCLEEFLAAIGSWAMDYSFIINNLYPKDKDLQHSGWPRMIEALMLKHHKWYNSNYSSVLNLFYPVNFEIHKDYLIGIHILQILAKDLLEDGSRTLPPEVPIGHLLECTKTLNYDEEQVKCVIEWFVNRSISRDGQEREAKKFPLISVDSKRGDPIEPFSCTDTDLSVFITPWGLYHIKRLIYQFRYWKNVFYGIPLREDVYNDIQGLDAEMINLPNIYKVIAYLHDYEMHWFRDKNDTERFGIFPIMTRIHNEIQRQVQSGMNF